MSLPFKLFLFRHIKSFHTKIKQQQIRYINFAFIVLICCLSDCLLNRFPEFRFNFLIYYI